MPLFNRIESEPPQDRLGVYPDVPEDAPAPEGMDVAASALRQSSLISGTIQKYQLGGFQHFDAQPSYDPLNDITGYEPYATRFLDSRSPQQTATIKRMVDSDLSDHRTLQSAGGWGLAATFAAGATDPVNLAMAAIPLGAPTRIAGLVRGAAVGAMAEIPIQAAQESLHPTQTREQSVFNVGTATVLNGILGAAISRRIPIAEFNAATESLGKDIETPFAGSTVGAASASVATTLEDEGVARGGEWLAKTLGSVSPLARLITSPAKSVRQLTQRLIDIPFALGKNSRGIATEASAELRTRAYDSMIAKDLSERDAIYQAYRSRVKDEGGAPLSRPEFADQVSYAMRRGDMHSIAEVAQNARSTRANILNSMTREAQALGQLPEELELVGAQSYLPRLYRVGKIKANLSAWRDRLHKAFVEQGADALEAKAAVDEVTNKVLGTTRGYVDLTPNIVAKSGPLKERTLNVPDEVLEPFLENNADKVIHSFVRSAAPQLEMARALRASPSERSVTQLFENEIKQVTDEFAVLKERAQGDDRLLSKLTQQEKSNLEDLNAMRDRVLGKHGIPADPDSFLVKSGRFIRTWSYLSKLGSQTIGSVADVGRVVTRYGLTHTAKGLATFATNLTRWKVARVDAKRLGAGLDWTLNTRGRSLGEIGDFAETRLQEYGQKFSNQFTRATGMATWNSTLKFLTVALEQDSILEAAIKGANSANTITKLAEMGIDQDMLPRIAKQFQQHGEVDGLRRARTELWNDREAANAVEQSLLKASDVVIMNKGLGDTPLLMSSELFKTLLQFKGFGIASVNRLLIPAAQGLARGDVAMLNGLLTMMGLGVLRYVAKQSLADQPIELTPARVLAEAVDGSGLNAYLADPYDVGADIAGLPRLSRYTDRSWLETLAGPSIGTAIDVGKTIQDLRRDGVSQRDIHKIRRLLPYQNLFYARRAINWLEDSTTQALGVPQN